MNDPVCLHLVSEILRAIGRLIKSNNSSYLPVDPNTGQAGNTWSSRAMRARIRPQYCSRYPIFDIEGQQIVKYTAHGSRDRGMSEQLHSPRLQGKNGIPLAGGQIEGAVCRQLSDFFYDGRS